MNADDRRQPEFWNRPTAKEASDVVYQNDAGSNPVLRGISLAVAATVISSSSWVQSILWKLNKFDQLKELHALDDYDPRHDPTVAPIAKSFSSENATLSVLPAPRTRPSSNSGRGYYTAADYYSLYKSGKLTPIDVANTLLPLIRRDTSPAGPHAIAFLDSKVDLVRRAAEASTARYVSGKPLSCLDGVPIAVKDEVEVKGYRRTLGSMMDFTNPANETAWCVRMLEEAGAIVIGKTSMHEMGLDTTSNNTNYGTPLNPHNPAYYTGGSSGGSAYAVAAGIVPIAVGADGGGSIRIPASFCGVYGLKPSHGRVSGRPTHTLGSVGVYGPIAGSIDDLALAYRIMGQPDRLDRHSAMFPSSLGEADLSLPKSSGQKVIGIYRPWVARSDPAVLSLFDQALSFYTDECGYEVVDISLPYLPQGQKAHALTILSEVRLGTKPAQIAQLTYANQILLHVIGSHATCQDFLAAQKLREMLMAHLAWLWERCPGMLVVTPTTPCGGWKVGKASDVVKGGYGVSDGDMSLKSMEYVYVANWTGCPAISCPMGFVGEKGDIPVGIMAMGQWGSEEQLLAWGREGEDLFAPGGITRPLRHDGWVDVLSMSGSK